MFAENATKARVTSKAELAVLLSKRRAGKPLDVGEQAMLQAWIDTGSRRHAFLAGKQKRGEALTPGEAVELRTIVTTHNEIFAALARMDVDGLKMEECEVRELRRWKGEVLPGDLPIAN